MARSRMRRAASRRIQCSEQMPIPRAAFRASWRPRRSLPSGQIREAVARLQFPAWAAAWRSPTRRSSSFPSAEAFRRIFIRGDGAGLLAQRILVEAVTSPGESFRFSATLARQLRYSSCASAATEAGRHPHQARTAAADAPFVRFRNTSRPQAHLRAFIVVDAVSTFLLLCLRPRSAPNDALLPSWSVPVRWPCRTASPSGRQRGHRAEDWDPDRGQHRRPRGACLRTRRGHDLILPRMERRSLHPR